jgi:hypothetical protein
MSQDFMVKAVIEGEVGVQSNNHEQLGNGGVEGMVAHDAKSVPESGAIIFSRRKRFFERKFQLHA